MTRNLDFTPVQIQLNSAIVIFCGLANKTKSFFREMATAENFLFLRTSWTFTLTLARFSTYKSFVNWRLFVYFSFERKVCFENHATSISCADSQLQNVNKQKQNKFQIIGEKVNFTQCYEWINADQHFHGYVNQN